MDPSSSSSSSRPYVLKFGTDYDYNYDPDGTSTPPNYTHDPYRPEYCAPNSPPASSSPERPLNDRITSLTHRLQSRITTRLKPPPKSRSPSPAPAPAIPTSPTPEYLELSQQPSTPLDDPTKLRKLLVLDMNGTLVYRSPHKPRPPRNWNPKQRNRHNNQMQGQTGEEVPKDWDPYGDPTAQRPLRVVHGRPYLKSFRDYLFHPETKKWLDTMVWSSAQPHSVADMVDKCFGAQKDELVAVWARDTLGLSDQDYHRKALTTKNLAKPWAALPLYTPSSSLLLPPPSTSTPGSQSPQRHSARTSLLLDDSPRKAYLQPWNHLCIQEYTGQMRDRDLMVSADEETLKRAAGLRSLLHPKAASPLAGIGSDEDTAQVVPSSLSPSSSSAPGGTSGSSVDAAGSSGSVIVDSGAQQSVSQTVDARYDKRVEKKKRKRETKNKAAAELVVREQMALAQERLRRDGNGVGGECSSADERGVFTLEEVLAGKRREYDLTLLAVVGVLDAVKRESNLAGWMRGGALKLATVDAGVEGGGGSAGLGAMHEEVSRASTPASSSGQEASPKRARISSEGAVDGASAPARVPAIEHSLMLSNLSNIGDTGQWFEDAEVVEKWVERGVKALEELGIEVESGVVDHNAPSLQNQETRRPVEWKS